jgi:peptidoglycan hydrolase FlgJ
MSAPPITSATDFQGLSALKKDAKANDPKALREAARQFESIFTRMVLKSMRDASPGDALSGGSEQGDFYQGMFDDQLALHLSQGKGMGLADMLVQQLMKAGVGSGATAAAGDGQRVTVNGQSSGPSLQPPASSQNSTHSLQPPATSQKADFIRKYMPQAERIGQQLGINPHSILAQAALETSWGQSLPTDAAGTSSANLFGVKARAADPSVTSSTIEYSDGIPSVSNERFRSYDSVSDSFDGYAALLSGNHRYSAALGTGDDVHAFATALQRGGYATDPNYARKVESVAGEVRALASGRRTADSGQQEV